MELRRMRIQDIRPDPDQPRKTFDDESIESLAETYKVEGQIVPIEVDGNGTIVTGERRWRAAKKAGLEEIDVIVHTPENRLRRQLIEELHRENIPELERARALNRFVVTTNMPNTRIAAMLGVGENYIRQLLAMVDEPGIEKAIEEGKIPGWKAVELKQALGTERAKQYIDSHEKEELRSLHREEDIRPVKRAPEPVKEAIAKGEIDFGDVAPRVDFIPEEEEEQEAFIEEIGIARKAREAVDAETDRILAQEQRRPDEVVDKSQRAADERRLRRIVRISEDVATIMITTISSIQDEEMRQEVVVHLQRIVAHCRLILESLGYFDIPKGVYDVREEP